MTKPIKGEVWRRKAGDRKPWLVAEIREASQGGMVRLVAVDDPTDKLRITVNTMVRGYVRCRA